MTTVWLTSLVSSCSRKPILHLVFSALGENELHEEYLNPFSLAGQIIHEVFSYLITYSLDLVNEYYKRGLSLSESVRRVVEWGFNRWAPYLESKHADSEITAKISEVIGKCKRNLVDWTTSLLVPDINGRVFIPAVGCEVPITMNLGYGLILKGKADALIREADSFRLIELKTGCFESPTHAFQIRVMQEILSQQLQQEVKSEIWYLNQDIGKIKIIRKPRKPALSRIKETVSKTIALRGIDDLPEKDTFVKCYNCDYCERINDDKIYKMRKLLGLSITSYIGG